MPNVAYLKKAIKAVGRGKGDHSVIRRYLIRRANALGARNLIPSNWNADGSTSLCQQQKAKDLPMLIQKTKDTESITSVSR